MTTTINQVQALCTVDDHRNILIGRASDYASSNGAFFAGLPVGTEVLSISGRRARWTGVFEQHNGHHAARLEVLDKKGRDYLASKGKPVIIHIHSCLGNVAWTVLKEAQ